MPRGFLRGQVIALGFAGVAAADPAALGGRAESDAAAGRTYFAQTAITSPGGDATLTVRGTLFPVGFGTLSLGLTDRVEVSVGGMWVPEMIEAGENQVFGHAKAQLSRGRRHALAIFVGGFRQEGHIYDDVGRYDVYPRVITAGGGLAASICGDAQCSGMFTAHLSHYRDVYGDTERHTLGGLSLMVGRGHTRLIADAQGGRVDGELTGFGFAGLRFARRRWSVDLGALLPLPLPLFALSVRL